MSDKKVLSFDRPADFYYQAAVRNLDGGRYISALPLIRQAIAKDPKNEEYLLTLAEIYTDIGKFDQSNAILFDLVEKNEDITECYYGLGCNFIGLNDLEKAAQSFEKYLDIDPYGEYRDDVVEFLGFIEEYGISDDDFLEDAMQRKGYDLAGEGKKSLDSGDFKRAIELLSSIEYKSDDMMFAKNNLALSHYCNKDTDEAIKIAKEVLKADKDNVHACCNLALFYADKGDYLHLTEYIGKIVHLKPQTPEDIYKIAITLCDLSQHETAVKFWNKYLMEKPYDEKGLFFAAIADYNCGNHNGAISKMGDIIKIDPNNSIAKYYCGYMKENGDTKDKIEYKMAVPEAEAKRRIKYIDDVLKEDEKSALRHWKEDIKFKDILIWGLEYGDIHLQRAMAGVIAGFKDESSEAILREYILKNDKPDAVKSDIFLMLKKMDAKEPYIASVGGNIVEVRVSMPDWISKKEE